MAVTSKVLLSNPGIKSRFIIEYNKTVEKIKIPSTITQGKVSICPKKSFNKNVKNFLT